MTSYSLQYLPSNTEKMKTGFRKLFLLVAIPGTIHALKSAAPGYRSEQELKNMSYKEVCRLYNIPE
jgi:hypothetical protein